MRFPFYRLRSAPLASLVGLLAMSVLPQQVSAQALSDFRSITQVDRIPAHANFSPVTQLNHQLPEWLERSQQTSARPIDLSATMRISFVLRRDPAVQAAFEQMLAAQQNTQSPFYHQWLTPQQAGKYFGPTANDLAALTSWITSQGLAVVSVAPNGMFVTASGTTAAVGNALHTSFANFSFGEEVRLSATAEPSIPSVLTPLIRSVQGLAEVRLRPMIHARPVQGARIASPLEVPAHPLLTLNGEYFLTPGDFAVIYDVQSVYNGGNTGAKIGSKAQHVAIIGESRVANTDISEFETITGLPSVTPTVIVPPGATDPGTTNTGAQDEATLDVDRVISTAPGAAVDLVVAADTSTQSGIFEAVAYNINTLLDPVMTISFGACEADAGSSNTDAFDTYVSTGAAEGITTLVSSGDSGAAGCDTAFKAAPTTQTAGINFLCSSTFVTCVGGTEFNDTASPSTYWSSTNTSTFVSALSYIPEGAWNEPSSVVSGNVVYAPASTGGGVSKYIAKPVWQSGLGVPADGFRDVPDVSFSSASHDGYFACLAYAGGDCANNYFEDFSGTSAAAPSMAGVVALVNTKVGTSAGNINPMLYGLAASKPSVFHDVTITSSGVAGCTSATPSICNNSDPGPTTLTGGFAGFTVADGYDQATGLGSIDIANLVSNATQPVIVGSFSLSANASTLMLTGGAVTGNTATISGTASGSYAGTVLLTCTVAYSGPGTASDVPSCAIMPNLRLPGTTTTATLTITSTASSTPSCTSSLVRHKSPWLKGSTGIVLAGFLLVFPLRRSRSLRTLPMVCLLAASVLWMSGCGGNGSSGNACPAPNGTTAGSYVVTVTGTDNTLTSSTIINLTIN